MKIKSMDLRPKAVVEGSGRGFTAVPITASPSSSPSTASTRYGDDPRYIDWRVFARSDRYFIKKFEDETNLRCHLLIDHSRSMGYGSGGYTKSQYAGTLAATLAYFLFTQGDAVGLATFDDQIREYMPPRNRPSYLRRLMPAWKPSPRARPRTWGRRCSGLAQMLTKRGMIVLISDLLTSIDRLEPDLGLSLRGRSRCRRLPRPGPGGAELRF